MPGILMSPCVLKSADSETDDPLMVPSGHAGRVELPQDSPPSPGSGLVLVVDDEAPVLLALRRILEGDRHRVALASSPAEAACALGDPALDVVLVDLGMGDASGLELLEQVKRERPEVEVIVMTGHASVDSAVDCMRRGAFDYLSKPFENLRRVRDTVRRAVATPPAGRLRGRPDP